MTGMGTPEEERTVLENQQEGIRTKWPGHGEPPLDRPLGCVAKAFFILLGLVALAVIALFIICSNMRF
jgi:hypothetical protein